MFLNIENRIKVIILFIDNNLIESSERYEKLRILATAQNIFSTTKTLRKLILSYFKTVSLSNKESPTRHNNKTKITIYDLKRLDRLVYDQRDVVLVKLYIQ